MKRLPAIIYNDGDYKYPNGLKVFDEAELNDKLSNGWDTGPVDKKNLPSKPEEPKKEGKPVHLWKNNELKEFLGLPLDDKTKRADLIKAVKAKG